MVGISNLFLDMLPDSLMKLPKLLPRFVLYECSEGVKELMLTDSMHSINVDLQPLTDQLMRHMTFIQEILDFIEKVLMSFLNLTFLFRL